MATTGLQSESVYNLLVLVVMAWLVVDMDLLGVDLLAVAAIAEEVIQVMVHLVVDMDCLAMVAMVEEVVLVTMLHLVVEGYLQGVDILAVVTMEEGVVVA